MSEGIDAARAFELLGLKKGATEVDVKRAYRTLAMNVHPDRAGEGTFSTTRMQELNLAYERALEEVLAPKMAKCVCRGFTRNPLCKAHEDQQASPTSEEPCSECNGTTRVKQQQGFSVTYIDCPKCSSTNEEK